MNHVTCDNCHKENIPQNNSIKIDKRVYCEDCLKTTFPNEDELKNREVQYEQDPTICVSCGKDNGRRPWPKHVNLPMCTECKTSLKERIIPIWVKGFMYGIAALVIFSITWNWKYFESYQKINDAYAAVDSGQIKLASDLMMEASSLTPEIPDLEILGSYYLGLEYLNQDKSQLALDQFIKCRYKLPEEYGVDMLIDRASSGAAFDTKDYPLFLSLNKAWLNTHEEDPYAWASVASAYACLYAENKQDTSKEKSLEYLEKAKSFKSLDEGLLTYFNRIEYRLFSKEIITKEEYDKRYPEGWKNN
ncbi:MAG: hypothetical protein CL840_12780 [Crocinitomicaceae bacterium]|nr:hypothetical protein [Crocinitomicaceae bacterium]|tara:strand:- start:4653 stop:5564 length:912 start_codon:yes stop_codon:yes gene_type:complete